jgi:hypothetical protein
MNRTIVRNPLDIIRERFNLVAIEFDYSYNPLHKDRFKDYIITERTFGELVEHRNKQDYLETYRDPVLIRWQTTNKQHFKAVLYTKNEHGDRYSSGDFNSQIVELIEQSIEGINIYNLDE